jgi:hypothetical protein
MYIDFHGDAAFKAYVLADLDGLSDLGGQPDGGRASAYRTFLRFADDVTLDDRVLDLDDLC